MIQRLVLAKLLQLLLLLIIMVTALALESIFLIVTNLPLPIAAGKFTVIAPPLLQTPKVTARVQTPLILKRPKREGLRLMRQVNPRFLMRNGQNLKGSQPKGTTCP